jgi:hypothetical protein
MGGRISGGSSFCPAYSTYCWPTPMVLATRKGLRLGIVSFGRTFLVPWSRVSAVVLTEITTLRAYHREALGFVNVQDEEFKLPTLR